jgi:hypothetical protein
LKFLKIHFRKNIKLLTLNEDKKLMVHERQSFPDEKKEGKERLLEEKNLPDERGIRINQRTAVHDQNEKHLVRNEKQNKLRWKGATGL